MVKFCGKCGEQLRDGVIFCRYCGTKLSEIEPIQKSPQKNESGYQRSVENAPPANYFEYQDTNGNATLSDNYEAQYNAGADDGVNKGVQKGVNKKKGKDQYILDSNQRKYFLHYIVPTLAIGSFIWFLGEFVFSSYMRDMELEGSVLIFYAAMVILDVVLFIGVYLITKKNNGAIGLLLFFAFCFLSGILSLPITILTPYESQVHMAATLSLSTALIVIFMGIFLRENYFAKGHILGHVVLFAIGAVIAEVVFIVAFDIHNFALTIPMTLIIMSIVSIMLMFYGAKITKKRDLNNWIFIAVNIFGRIVLSLFIAIGFIAIVVLIFVLCFMGGSPGDINLGGGSGSWGSGSKKKKNKDIGSVIP